MVKKVSTDLFELAGQRYLVVMDYYSRFIKILSLMEITSQAAIQKLKSVFARWGIPEELVSDNGTQFKSAMFDEFKAEYGFKHTTSSPHPRTGGSVPYSYGRSCNSCPSYKKDTGRADHGKTDTNYHPNNGQSLTAKAYRPCSSQESRC